jgi:hypothetical protein
MELPLDRAIPVSATSRLPPMGGVVLLFGLRYCCMYPAACAGGNVWDIRALGRLSHMHSTIEYDMI